jgi:apolipoprotein N-acyltransferase
VNIREFIVRWWSSRWVRRAVALGSGALLTCAFAPLQWWLLAIVCPAILILLWEGERPREAAWLGFWFNAGTFAAGTYWLYVAIHTMGQAPVWIAFVLMAGLVGIMALYHALLGYVVARWLPQTGLLRWLVAVPAAWVFIEWWRGWFLSGFAWLSLGYTQTDTWLARLAPVLGVYGVSLVLLICAGALIALALGSMKQRAIAGAAFVAPWLVAAGIQSIEWTRESGKTVEVAIVQGAIPQEMKWLDENRETILRTYRRLTDVALAGPGAPPKLVVWPEASLPLAANDLVDYLRELYRDASARGTGVVLGAVRADDNFEHYYNSVLAMDEKVAWYDKDHLVPFSEVIPVPDFVRKYLQLMRLPYADFTRGGRNQPALQAGGLKLATTICYEDAYGSSQLAVLREADALVNVTNDAWFGRGSARHQHLQISRMRAIEANRFLLRAANDGISAVIGPRGQIVAEAPGFTPYVLRSSIAPRIGLPPYARFGNWLIVGLAACAVVFGAWTRHRAGTRYALGTSDTDPMSYRHHAGPDRAHQME